MASPSFFICYSMVCRFERGVVVQTYDFENLSLVRSELALEASVFLSGRTVSENSCIRGRCLFGEGGLQELVQLLIHSECLTGDDSIAYNR